MTIPITTPEEAGRRAIDAVNNEYQELKIKTGSGIDADLERVRAVKDAAPEVALKVDANQAWTVKEAMTFLERLREAGINLELLEQPVPKDNIEGMAAITERSRVPIAADETIFSPADAIRVVRANAADIINIKLGKSGILDAVDIVSIADAANLELMIGCMLEGSIGIHTAAHLVAGTGAFNYVDLDGNRLLAEDVIPTGTGPEIDITGPGHGVAVEARDL
jgi:L-alanine-DL-glutamate epimerase-like enolase superfamily enzyme